MESESVRALLRLYSLLELVVTSMGQMSAAGVDRSVRSRSGSQMLTYVSSIKKGIGGIGQEPHFVNAWTSSTRILQVISGGGGKRIDLCAFLRYLYFLSGITWEKIALLPESLVIRSELLVTVHPLSVQMELAQFKDWSVHGSQDVLPLLEDRLNQILENDSRV